MMENGFNPLVSILMTCYNRQAFIAEAINSVLALAYQNWELIIVDDCSSDRSFAIAEGYARNDRRIRIFRNAINLGDYPNRNKAASYAKGKYLKYLDSDDLILPWALDVMIMCMESFPDAALGVSQNVTFNIPYPKCFSPASIYRLYYYRNLLLTVGPTATIIRRKVFEEFNGFNEVRFVGDTELWLRMCQKYPLVLIPPGQIVWREHEEQQISEERKNISIEKVRLKINEEILRSETCPLSPDESSIILQNLRNIKCRRIIQNCLSGKLKIAINRRKHLQLSFKDFVFAFKKNKVPANMLNDL